MAHTHTPGPWFLRDRGIFNPTNGLQLGLACGLRNEAEADANARLIAAAPDLLAALMALADTHEMLYHPKDKYRKASKEGDMAKARAAIAKASGA